MSLTFNPADVHLAWPEIVLSVWGMGVLTLDFIFPQGSRRWLAYTAILGLLVTLGLVLGQWGGAGVLGVGFSGLYTADRYALFFKVVFLAAAVLTLLMAVDYLEEERTAAGEFDAILLFSTVGMLLMASASDLLSLFVALETMSVSLYILVGFLKREQKSSEAALKYLLMGGFSTGVILYGMVLLYGVAGSTNLKEIARVAAEQARNPALLLGMALLAAGFGFKIAAVPFHMYVPDVYEGAPHPVTAFLAGASEIAGLAVLLRVFLQAIPAFQVNWTLLFWVLSVLTMTVGNVIALSQRNIKRMLAYSSIAHVGYMLIGLVAGGTLGVSAALLYGLVYSLMTLGAFAMVILLCRGTVKGDQIDDFSGLAQKSPLAAAAMLVFLLSLTGVPPTGGFIGKLYLFGAAIEARYVWLAVIAVVNSAISLYYYMQVAMVMYMRDLPAGGMELQESGSLRAALALALIGTLIIGIYPGPFLEFARASVVGFLG